MLQMFQLFRTYIANVSSRCYKSRSGVTHVAVGSICRRQQPPGAAAGPACMRVGVERAQAGYHVGVDRDGATRDTVQRVGHSSVSPYVKQHRHATQASGR
jgi:hypothetical protein